jgi:hypothetical protein
VDSFGSFEIFDAFGPWGVFAGFVCFGGCEASPPTAGGVVGVGGSAIAGGGTAVPPVAGGFGFGFGFGCDAGVPPVPDCCGAAPARVGDVLTPPFELVVPVADDVGAAVCVGAAAFVCVTARWCVRWTAGGETTTFSVGAALEPAPARIGGRCTVPESRIRAIAAAPRSSGITGAATRRAITQIASHLPPSLADTGLSSPSLDGASLGLD